MTIDRRCNFGIRRLVVWPNSVHICAAKLGSWELGMRSCEEVVQCNAQRVIGILSIHAYSKHAGQRSTDAGPISTRIFGHLDLQEQLIAGPRAEVTNNYSLSFFLAGRTSLQRGVEDNGSSWRVISCAVEWRHEIPQAAFYVVDAAHSRNDLRFFMRHHMAV